MLVKYIENKDIIVAHIVRCDVVRSLDDEDRNVYLLRLFTQDFGDVVLCKSTYTNCLDALNDLYDNEKLDLSCNANFEVEVMNVFSPEMLFSMDDILDADEIDIGSLYPDIDDDADYDDEY